MDRTLASYARLLRLVAKKLIETRCYQFSPLAQKPIICIHGPQRGIIRYALFREIVISILFHEIRQIDCRLLVPDAPVRATAHKRQITNIIHFLTLHVVFFQNSLRKYMMKLQRMLRTGMLHGNYELIAPIAGIILTECQVHGFEICAPAQTHGPSFFERDPAPVTEPPDGDACGHDPARVAQSDAHLIERDVRFTGHQTQQEILMRIEDRALRIALSRRLPPASLAQAPKPADRRRYPDPKPPRTPNCPLQPHQKHNPEDHPNRPVTCSCIHILCKSKSAHQAMPVNPLNKTNCVKLDLGACLRAKPGHAPAKKRTRGG